MNDYLDVATEAVRWAGAQAVPAERGSVWLENDVPVDDLYSGTASVLLGCTEATAYGVACDEPAGRALARLVSLVSAGAVTGEDQGLFGTWPGWLVALRAWARVSGDAQATQAGDRLVGLIARSVLEGDATQRPYDVISGDAGTLVALLGEDASEARHLLADRLVAAVWDGPTWPWRPGETMLMPGFSHGPAGIAHALALTGDELGRPELIELAGRAGQTLMDRAMTADGWRLQNRVPAKETGPEYGLGWCHGPSGTVRLFTLLDRLDPRPQWRQAVDACLEALRTSGLPERRYPGFWDNVGRCCGTAGVGMTLLDRFQATGERGYLVWAGELADDVIGHATVDGDGMRWSNVEHTAAPPELPATPGLMQGAVGVASWLARLGRLQVDPSVPPPWRVGGSSYC